MHTNDRFKANKVKKHGTCAMLHVREKVDGGGGGKKKGKGNIVN